MGKQSNRERQLWTEFVQAKEREGEKKAKRSRAKNKPQPSPAELDSALDDLVKGQVRDCAKGSAS